ncbi:MAG: recombinase family protein [Lawsonibacter sp.]|nr:recombinase family protein [Lawsonibacter sp.]
MSIENGAPLASAGGVVEIKIAAAYIRVSTDDQIEYSPEAQIVEIRKYAAAHGYIIPDTFVFTDEGLSGKKTVKRDSFNKMIGIAKKKPKPFEAILLWKFSRFARNREDSIVYKSMLRKQLGIDVISVSEPVGDDKMSIIIEAMIEAMDEYYSINLAEEVRRGMSEKARRGELQSTPSFGYTVKDNRLIPLEKEADLVRNMFQRYLAGEGFVQIAKWLNAMGVLTHRGNQFENRTVEYILRNPVYIGKLRWNPTGRSHRNFDNDDIILSDAEHEPLIDMDTWDAVQASIRTQKARLKYHARPTYDRKDWLSGIVRCANCGTTLIFAKPHYFKCNNYVRGSCQFSQHVKVEILHEAVLNRLRADFQTGSMASFKVLHHADGSASELEALERRQQNLKRKKERLREAFLNGTDTVEEYAEMKALLAQEEAEIMTRLTVLRSSDADTDMQAIMRQKISECLSILEAPDTSLEQKYEAANSIIERCIFSKGKSTLEITYRLIF